MIRLRGRRRNLSLEAAPVAHDVTAMGRIEMLIRLNVSLRENIKFQIEK